jgi:hypothetical protein
MSHEAPPLPVAEPGPGVAWPSAAASGSGDDLSVDVQDTEYFRAGARNSRSGLFEFNDAEKIKQKVRESRMVKKKHSVDTFYKTDGLFQQVARDRRFENLTLGVISANAIWIAIDTDYNNAPSLLTAGPSFVVGDIIFFTYFSVELFIRFSAFRKKLDCMKDAWFVFDSFLVALYALDPFIIALVGKATGGSGTLPGGTLPRLLRLARLTRLVRMFRALPELMIMIRGIYTAAASVSYTLGLLFVVTYVFAIALTQMSDGFDFREDFCHGVAMSMYTLIIYGTFLDDLSEFADAVRVESTPCLILCTVFVVLASMTIMNMLIGVLCEVISGVAQEERETLAVDEMNDKFHDIVMEMDHDNGGTISADEFQKIMQNDIALHQLQKSGVDPEIAFDLMQDLFFDSRTGEPIADEIEIGEFMGKILDMRGGQEVHVRDVMNLDKAMKRKFGEITVLMQQIENKMDRIKAKRKASRQR